MKILNALLIAALMSASAAAAPLSFGDMHYRWVGPAVMGGRLDVVAGVPRNPKVIYLGHASGGLWKSVDGGLSFASIFESGSTSAVGAIAIDPTNPQRIYIGTGEPFPRNTADYGDGVWRSTDGGKRWTHLGLRNSASIAKIAVDPANPKVLLVAAVGREFAPSTERGIYRSSDGGAHFTRVLFVNATTGGSDVAFDPRHPNVAYAGTFDFLRRPWTLRSGGPGSGLYQSLDGGKTWRRLTDPRLHNGLPDGPMNRVGVSVCRSNPDVVYAFVPVKNGMLYRTTDGGKHWSLRNASQDINFRPFYFSQVRCDPHNPDRVYAVAGPLLVSGDGGRTFHDAGGGGDNHDLWIDPSDSERLLNGSDMGFHYSLDGGKTWSYDNIVPFDQIYRVGYDMDEPYHVMGGMQDHEVWWGPSELFSRGDGPSDGDWLDISDWGDGQYAMADPRDSSIVYEDTHFGDLVRANLKTGERRYISPQPIIGFGTGAATYKYRFNWSAPLLLSHFDPGVLYFGGNVLFRSADQGTTWTQISPDLTRCSSSQIAPSGGPITYDNTNAETYCTIYSIGEDATDAQSIWYGTDNGHLELTRDGGKTWNDLIGNVPNLPLPARVASISPSPARSQTAYAVFDRHLWNDYHPYAYVTHDFGRTWRSISTGLGTYVHVVREDPHNPQLLYAGTERGIDVSFDGGASWRDLRLGLPHIPVYDLQVHPRDNDLIVGSHARGFYILDDLTPLQQWTARAGDGTRPYLFAPMTAYRYNDGPYHEHGRGAFVSENKPYGALATLYLPKAPQPSAPKAKPSVRVRVLDASGAEIDTFDAEVHAGINRFAWNLHTEAPGGSRAVQDRRYYYIFFPMTIEGPQVLPGTYTLEVTAFGERLRAPVTVRMDPRNTTPAAQLQAQYDALRELAGIQERAEQAIRTIEDLRKKIGGNSARYASLDAALSRELDRLRNPEPSGYRQPARISEETAYLRDTIEQYTGVPTQAQLAYIKSYGAQMDAVETALKSLLQLHAQDVKSLETR